MFEAYPQLRKYKVVLAVEKQGDDVFRVYDNKAGSNLASFAPKGKGDVGTITLNKGYDAKRSLVHEIQHAIQEIGGSPSELIANHTSMH